MFMNRLPYALFLLALSGILPGSSALSQEQQWVKVEIRSLCHAGVINGLQFRSKNGIEKLDIYSRGFGLPLLYQGPRDLVFFRTEQKAEQFEAVVEVVGQVRIPDAATHLMLLFEKDTEADEERYKITAIPNDPRQFPPGAFRFFNITGDLIYAVVDGKEMRLPPRGTQMISTSGNEDGNFEIRMYRNPGPNVEKIYSSVWHTRESRRTNVFLSSSGTRVQEISVKKIVEPVVIDDVQAPTD